MGFAVELRAVIQGLSIEPRAAVESKPGKMHRSFDFVVAFAPTALRMTKVEGIAI
jgi:hypothetical protein